MENTKESINFELTPSQKVACEKIEEFIKKPIGRTFKEKVLVIKGKAGVGKTTLIKYALRKLIEKDEKSEPYNEDDFFSDFSYEIPNVMGVTISHKAKLRLQYSVPNACTYAAYFGLRPIYAFDGSLSFEKQSFNKFSPKIHPHQIPFLVVTHDEVSMYDMNYINTLEKYTHSNSKIILIGDNNQLPPITSKLEERSDLNSPAFTYFENYVELTERVRQTAGNPILDLSDEISKEIQGDKNLERILELISKDVINNNIGYRKIARTDVISSFVNTYKENSDTRIICYKNVTIDAINKRVRKKLFPNTDERFVKGDALYMNKTFKNEEKQIFFNSDEMVISDIVKFNKANIEYYKAQIKGDIPSSYLILLTENGQLKYDKILKEKSKKAKEASFKIKGQMWKEFYDFQDKFANVSYGYAFTAYKAQGSGFKNVYVDVTDIQNTKLSDKRKLQTLYTAITRATHQVIFF